MGLNPAFIANAAYPIPIGMYPKVIGIAFLHPIINSSFFDIILLAPILKINYMSKIVYIIRYFIFIRDKVEYSAIITISIFFQKIV